MSSSGHPRSHSAHPGRHHHGGGHHGSHRAWDPADAPEGEDRWSKADYEKRMALRRSNANLRGRLQQTEAQLRSALWQLRREKERADRAEALFLEMKSESEALKDELRKAGMAGRR